MIFPTDIRLAHRLGCCVLLLARFAGCQASPAPQSAPVRQDSPAAAPAVAPPATEAPKTEAPAKPPAASRNPAIRMMKETQVVDAPGPTVAPAFGNVLAFAGDRLVISGAVLARRGGAEGQIFTFALKDGKWESISEMVQVQAVAPEEFAIQRIVGDPEYLLTNISRRAKSSEIISFAPAEGREAWKQSGAIKAPENEKLINFASTMALSNNVLAVGEVIARPNMKDEDYSTNPRVFIFARTPEGWKAQGALQRDAKKTPWWFGVALAMDGDTLVVGNPMGLQPYTTDTVRANLESAAMVCVYRRSPAGWKLEQEITNAGMSPWQGFGVNVALQGDLMAVRSINPANRDEIVDVCVLRRDNGRWTFEGLLNTGPGVTRGRGFGYALAVDHGRILVGDPSAVEGSDANGRVFVFEKEKGGWREKLRLSPKVFVSPNSFGGALAVQWPWVAVGRIRNERLGIEPGGALLYNLDAPPVAAAATASEPAAGAVPKTDRK